MLKNACFYPRMFLNSYFYAKTYHKTYSERMQLCLGVFTCTQCAGSLNTVQWDGAAVVCSASKARLCKRCMSNLNTSAQFSIATGAVRLCPIHASTKCAPAKSAYQGVVSRLLLAAQAASHFDALARGDHVEFIDRFPYAQCVRCPCCSVLVTLNYQHVPNWALMKCGSCHNIFCAKCMKPLLHKRVTSHFYFVANTHDSAWLTCDDDPCCAPTVAELSMALRRMVHRLGTPSLPYPFSTPEARAAMTAPKDDDLPILVAMRDMVAAGVERSSDTLLFKCALAETMVMLDWMTACCADSGFEVATEVLVLYFALLPRSISGQAVASNQFWSAIAALDPGLQLATTLVQ